MHVSIIVLNYNYGRFVGQAIESALRQTYADREVIVVDNGSTDDSPEVIGRYADRVRVVRQPNNIGQGQGYNLGIEAALGEWIIWLDADDLLDDDAIAACMALVGDDTSKVQFPLRVVDAEGRHTSGLVPFLRHQGDVAPIIRRFGLYAGPPGSGNLYRKSAVAPYFPVPPGDWPICTDTVPFLTAPFHGKVVDAGRPLGCYRVHRKAPSEVPGYKGNNLGNIGSISAEVRLNYSSRAKTLALLRERSGIDVPGPFLTLPTHARYRVISWRWTRELHPFPEDSAATLWRHLSDSLRECPGYRAIDRIAMRIWAFGVLFLPEPFATKVMAVNRSTPFWDAVMRWSRGANA